MAKTTIIRQRGQITIPREIRRQYRWLEENEVISFNTNTQNRLIIEPASKRSTDWRALRKQLARVARYTGKRGNLSQFIIQDRHRH